MGSSGVLTDLTNALIRSNVKTLTGTIATTPALLITDGAGLKYCCDVNIGAFDSTGHINQYKNDLLGIPGTSGFTGDDVLTFGTTLRNVPLARNNNALIYADIGTAVLLSRNGSGVWQIDGLAEAQVGTYVMIPVDVKNKVIGPIQNITITQRPLTLGEIGVDGGGFGVTPFGSVGIFENNVFEGLV